MGTPGGRSGRDGRPSDGMGGRFMIDRKAAGWKAGGRGIGFVWVKGVVAAADGATWGSRAGEDACPTGAGSGWLESG